MTADQVIKHFGGPTESVAIAATELGVTKQLVYHWRSSGIPYDTQCRIQIETRGKLKAERV
jgi:hypothetical protein